MDLCRTVQKIGLSKVYKLLFSQCQVQVWALHLQWLTELTLKPQNCLTVFSLQQWGDTVWTTLGSLSSLENPSLSQEHQLPDLNDLQQKCFAHPTCYHHYHLLPAGLRALPQRLTLPVSAHQRAFARRSPPQATETNIAIVPYSI